ncbi:MAG: reverse transcriptase family protein [Candidatus Pedobacter colombiensis]|uniref:RNA-directed DNA polymerase n=1 Tax=Candidatus Pedobacter colombiensis TaxID=3121371 RepID=A0AAJ5W620_9SPHI|nr:reverse transcriptase family protein [Pedobacter sp.]WEK18669.1 MAG: reverse transcriptase family protein [Pedobacter sp.]
MLDINKLCRILLISQKELNHLLENIDKYYYLISNPKLDKAGIPLIGKNGKPRTRDLYPSVKLLKDVQKRIYNNLLKKIKLPDYAFGGIAKRDNILNAKMHQGNKFFFNTDLRNFYPGITHNQVFDMFMKRKFSPTISSILTKLTTYKGSLPQGTPTSPYLANLAFYSAGNEIDILTREHGLIFTTFVDDITISSKTNFQHLINEVMAIIISKGFKISHNKTFYQTKHPKVTNIIVKNNGLYLAESYKKKIDAFEDKETPEAKGTINYYKRVHKISKTKSVKLKEKVFQKL